MARLRRLFTRLRPDDTEVAILRGALTEIERSLNRTDTGPK
jgi:tRNA C32,U32 (ribose-2'-O)-methylase TrmJ